MAGKCAKMGFTKETTMRIIVTMAALLLAVAVVPEAQSGRQVVYKIGDQGVNAPVLTKKVTPHYTGDAMRRKVQGTVVVDAVVLADGTVGDVIIRRSVDPDLDEEVVKATKQWRFKPGTKDGEPVAVEVFIEHTFTLRA
jgi:TonB family protein